MTTTNVSPTVWSTIDEFPQRTAFADWAKAFVFTRDENQTVDANKPSRVSLEDIASRYGIQFMSIDTTASPVITTFAPADSEMWFITRVGGNLAQLDFSAAGLTLRDGVTNSATTYDLTSDGQAILISRNGLVLHFLPNITGVGTTISADADNILTLGTDSAPFLKLSSNAENLITLGSDSGIYSKPSSDPNNALTVGTDGHSYVNATRNVRVLTLNRSFTAGEVIDITGMGADFSVGLGLNSYGSDTIFTLGTSAGDFDTDSRITVFRNGIAQQNGDDVIWDSSTTFHFVEVLYALEVIEIVERRLYDT